ncbi:O-fucosyltransferase 9, variant 2 [Trifolium repens]|nr:O-fucosyltransferase 9, variant 2 [Trifolium repens]
MIWIWPGNEAPTATIPSLLPPSGFVVHAENPYCVWSWRGKFRRNHRIIKPGVNRVDGKCPLTPLEVGMILRGMGSNNTTLVYVAAGKIYKEQKYMAPLKQIFPRLQTKNTLETPEELAQFMGHSSRLAALDYTVCLHSEVLVTTQGGNFPHFLMGHKRYMYGGHAKTSKPDKRRLALYYSITLMWYAVKMIQWILLAGPFMMMNLEILDEDLIGQEITLS